MARSVGAVTGAVGLVIGLSAIGLAGCGGASPNASVEPRSGVSRPTVAEDRWDRPLDPGDSVLVHNPLVTLRKGQLPTDAVRELTSIESLAIADDGSVLVVDIQAKRLVRVTRDGAFEAIPGTAAGTGDAPAGGVIAFPHKVAVAPDGTIWIADGKGLFRIDAAGVTTNVVPFPGSQDPFPEDIAGRVAATAELPGVRALAIDPQGRPVLAWATSIFRLERDGTLTHLAGTSGDDANEGGPATGAGFRSIDAVQVRADGSMLVLDSQSWLVREIAPSGTITTWGGVVPKAITAKVGALTSPPQELALASDGSAVVTLPQEGRIVRVTSDAVTVLNAKPGLWGALASMDDGSVLIGDDLGGLTRLGT